MYAFRILPSKALKQQAVRVTQSPCSAAVHAEIGFDFNGVSVVRNGFIHPLHVRQTAVLHREAEDFWV